MTIKFLTPPERYARLANGQRELANELATKIEAGDPIDSEIHRKFASSILRLWARQLSDIEPRNPGHQPEVDPGAVAVQYACLRGGGMKKYPAIAKVAEDWGVTNESIKKALKKHGEEALQTFAPDHNQKKK